VLLRDIQKKRNVVVHTDLGVRLLMAVWGWRGLLKLSEPMAGWQALPNNNQALAERVVHAGYGQH